MDLYLITFCKIIYSNDFIEMATPSNNLPYANITLIIYLLFSKHTTEFTYVAHARK